MMGGRTGCTEPKLCRLVAAKLRRDWSPEQIAGWLPRRYPGEARMPLSHETIYRTLYVQARGALKKELLGHLRRGRSLRRSRRHSTAGQRRGRIVDAVPIAERPTATTRGHTSTVELVRVETGVWQPEFGRRGHGVDC
jgi:IS30 family transposase